MPLQLSLMAYDKKNQMKYMETLENNEPHFLSFEPSIIFWRTHMVFENHRKSRISQQRADQS